MPQVIYYHLWGDSPYDYSEGSFYTIAEKYPSGEQQKYSSSGTHITLGTRERMLELIRQNITNDLKDDLEWKFVSVGEFTAAENDHYCCFSGPPSNCTNIYKLDQDQKLYLENGTDILA
jgi:hypothetical protein